MSKDILLAKNKDPNVIDLAVGEATLIRDALSKFFNLNNYQVPNCKELFEYPTPNGYPGLVSFLEDKYQAPVIICNGAKQALAASFYSLYQLGYRSLGMRIPYWALIPPLAQEHNLNIVFKNFDSYLCVAPNNPDGFYPQDIEDMALSFKESNIPFIHDAVYWNYSYISRDINILPSIGDMQIFSASKLFGLSGIRIGWIVCHNPKFYHHLQYYMEMMTVGVSIMPQLFLLDLLQRMKYNPEEVIHFENEAYLSLQKSREILKKIPSSTLSIENNVGMFAWCKKGPKIDFSKTSVSVLDGKFFGSPGMVRINLATKHEQLEKAVQNIIETF